MYEVSSRRRCE